MKNKKRWGLNRKTLTAIVIFTLLMCIFSCLSGSFIFYRAVSRLYNEKGYVVANIILSNIDHDKIAQYTKTWEADDYYHEMEEYLKQIEDHSQAAYIYIAVPYEDKTMRYVYDSDTYIGDSDPIAASFDEIWTSYKKGVRPKSYLVRNSKKYGFLTSSCLPVKDSTGQVIALLFVDTRMEVILLALSGFVINMFIISLVFLTVFSVLHWHYMHKFLISPLMLIRSNVKNFAANNASNDNSLSTIKTNDELEDLAVSVEQMEKDIISYIDNIQTITAEKERIGAELNVATRIQADMLPKEFPPFPDRKEFDIYAAMDPAKEVGGDFYDFFLIDDDHLALVIADVAGKGIPASLFMVRSMTLIKAGALSSATLSPADILFDVNNQLRERNDTNMFVTVWLGIIQISTGKGISANAGHEHPIIKRKNGSYKLKVYRHSPAVAAIDGMTFLEHQFSLHPGDTLFVYTDGVAEAANSEGEFYGTERLIDALNKEPDVSTGKLIKNVRDDIDRFVGDAPQFDDMTMLTLKYYGG